MNRYNLYFTTRRFGLHYFPDAQHYRESDLCTWVPILRSLGASWLTLPAPNNRAIPEFFLNGLLEAQIQPILHFQLPLEHGQHFDSLPLLIQQYARWGVQYITLFDRPNLRSSWPADSWAQRDLVERFLDFFLPLAELVTYHGLTPVFPPLQPGGDYWDTAFLRGALRGMVRRGQYRVLNSFVLGAYAWAGNRPLNWGAGGPERWPGARPYFTPPGTQDQRGFRVFDWYLPLLQAELGNTRPIFVLKAGSLIGDRSDPALPEVSKQDHRERNLALVRWVEDDPDPDAQDRQMEPIPEEVMACNFWLMSADPTSPHYAQAWFQSDEQHLPVVDALHKWISKRQYPFPFDSPRQMFQEFNLADSAAQKVTPTDHPITHYLLLPLYEWGVNEWHLDQVKEFVTQHQPTVGFSLEEAVLARRVTVVGGLHAFPEEVVARLRTAGCTVERITADGTLIAT